MRLSVLLATLALAASEANAAPAQNEARDAYLTFYMDSFWKGQPLVVWSALDNCWNIPNPYDVQITSAMINKGIVCTVWTEKLCQGSSFWLPYTYPELPGGFNDKVKSFKCRYG